MYCPNCGNKIKEETTYCTNCGVKLKKETTNHETTQANLSRNNNGNTALILGIIACVTFWLPVLSIPLAIISIITGKNNQKETGKSTVGPILGIISLVLTTIEIIIIVISMIFFVDFVREEIENEAEEYPIIDRYEDYFNDTTESFDIKGYIWQATDNSVLYLNKDNSYTWYQDDTNHNDNFYVGTYEFYTGTDAIDYITYNLKEYGITEEEQRRLFQNGQYNLSDYYLVMLNCTKMIVNGTEQTPQTPIVPYYGFYDSTTKRLSLVNMNTGNKAEFTIKEKLSSIDL